MQFKKYVAITEYNQYITLLEHIEKDTLDEFAMPKFVQYKLDFLNGIANSIGTDVKSLVKVFKDKVVFGIFKKIKFSLGFFFNLVKKGYKEFKKFEKILFKYVSEHQPFSGAENQIIKLQKFMENHPKIMKVSGIVVAGVLLYIWLNMTFTGSAGYDFDNTAILDALSGNFDLIDLFTGPDGTKLLVLLATGLLGLSFPWPGKTSVQLIGSLIYSIAKKKNLKIQKPSFIK